METREELIEVLNDLVKINNDRIAGYEKAISEANEHDVTFKGLFEDMIKESRQYKGELAAEITRSGGEVEDETTSSGKIYRAWMDVKATFTDSDKTTILDSCHFGEHAALNAYDAALAADSMLEPDTRKMVAQQRAGVQQAHDIIKKNLDAHTALKNSALPQSQPAKEGV